MSRVRGRLWSVGLLLSLTGISQIYSQDVSQQILNLTGGERTRIAWIRGGERLMGGGSLVGFDTETGVETVIRPAALNRNKPIICSGGYRVVFSSDFQVYVVNWDGTDERLLTDGICSDVWSDPRTGLEWAIVRKGRDSTGGEVIRYLIDDPAQEVLLWDQSPAGDYYMSWYQASADGRVAVDFLPWNKAYVIEDGALTTNGFYTHVSSGCWSSLSSDNSYVWFNFPSTGRGHVSLAVFRNETALGVVPIDAGPLPAGVSREYFHPKFASKGGRHLVLTGGYPGGQVWNKVEVYFGRFAPDYGAFDGWVRLTNNSEPDLTPDAWVGVAPPSPSMRFSVDTLAFEAAESGSSPAPLTVAVTTPYGTLESVTAESDRSWLSVDVSGSADTYAVRNTVNSSGLSSGVYRATITVRSPSATPLLRTYRVKLTVRGMPVATGITIMPEVCAVSLNSTKQFIATVFDQHEEPMVPQPAIGWSVTGPGTDVSVDNGLLSVGATTGLYTMSAAAGAVSGTATVNVVEYIPVNIKVNCGDPTVGYVPQWVGDGQYLDHDGDTNYVSSYWRPPWISDGGVDLSDVDNPPPTEALIRFRAGETRYNLREVPRGTYKVRIHFMEMFDVHPDSQRSISCTAEDQVQFSDFNPQQEAGGKFKAIAKEFVTEVDDDGLQLVIGGFEPMWSAIEVISVGSEGKQIAILAPLGGERLAVGEVVEIRWSAVPDVRGADIEMSPDGGESWYSIIDSTMVATEPNWGVFRWQVQPEVSPGVSAISEEVLFRITDYQRPSVLDASTTPVSIGALDGVLNPAGSTLFTPRFQALRGGVIRMHLPASVGRTVRVFMLDGRRVMAHTGSGSLRYNLKMNGQASSYRILDVTTERTKATMGTVLVR